MAIKATKKKKALQKPVKKNNQTHQLLILLLILLLSAIIYNKVQIYTQKEQAVESAPTPTTQPPRIIKVISADTLPDADISGWKEYTHDRFSIKIPSTWSFVESDDSLSVSFADNAEFYNGSRYPDPEINSIGIGLTNEYVIPAHSFFDLNHSFWQDTMRRSGGGGKLQTDIIKTQVANLQTVKRTRIWTEGIESEDRKDTDYYIPDPYSEELYVWNITYNLPLNDTNLLTREKLNNKIVSTFTLLK